MSVLLIGARGALGESVVGRLLGEGDQVGVVGSSSEGSAWRALGAYVAHGDPTDPDFIERAGQHARTVVVFDDGPEETAEVVTAVIAAAAVLPEAPRVVLHSHDPSERVTQLLEGSALDYVVLVSPRPRGVFRTKGLPADAIAEAVSAADDLAGTPRLRVELGTAEGSSSLGLQPN